jgi:hypothetical protein
MSNLATIVNNILADSGIDDINVVVTTGSYNNPAWITALSWGKISGTPTTLSGYGITDAVPSSRTLTINGTSYDLSANRSWTIAAGVSSIIAGTGISVSGSGNITVTNTGVLSINGSTGAITGIINTSNYNSYSPTLTGGGASGDWGINITGTAGSISGYNNPRVDPAANTIAYRDGNGYLQAVYYYSSNSGRQTSGLNSLTGKLETGAGYLYEFTAGAVQSFLGLGSAAYTSSDNYLLRNNVSGTPAAVYYTTSGSVSVLKVRLPFSTASDKMVCFTVRIYQSYIPYDIQISGYLYSTINNWYEPKAIMIVGGAPINVVMGRDSDGRAYVAFSGGSYTGAAVFNVVGGYQTADWNTGWSITNDSNIPTQSLNQTVYPTINTGNYSSYSPTLTGGGASGTWGISITGSAGSASSASTAGTVTHNSGRVDSAWYNAVWASGTPSPMYSCDAVQIQSSTGSIRATTLSASNNLFIGTGISGPVATPAYIDTGLNYSNGTTRDKLKIYLYNSGTEKYGFTVGSSADIQYHSNGRHDFYISNSSVITINSSGLIGNASTATAAQGATFLTQPNATWGARMQLGGNGAGSGVANIAVVQATDGNLHMDNGVGKSMYLNYYHNGIIYLNGGTYYISANGSQYNGNAATATSTASISASTSIGISSSYSTTINTTTPGLSNYGINFIGSSISDNASGITWAWSGNAAQAGIYVQSSGSYGTKMYLATTDSFATGSKIAVSIDHLGNTNITRGALQQGGNQVLHAGNYNSYAPTLTGGGASGTWGISITGSAATPTQTTTNYAGNIYVNPQTYFGNTVGLKVAMTGAWTVWSDTLWINGYSGGDVLQMCALHTMRNGTPRMAISVQASTATSYGTFYEFITAYNIASQSVSYAATAGSAPNGSNANSIYNVTPGDGNGIQFWSSSSYKISMGVGSLYQYGPVIDYSIKMQMDTGSTGRGFTWGRDGVTPIAALNSTTGNMRIAGDFTSTYSFASGDIRLGDMWGGAGLYRPSGNMVFGIQDSDWIFSKAAVTQAFIAGGDGNLWMRWAGDYISNLLAARGSKAGQNTWTTLNYFETNNGGYAVNNSNSASLQAYSVSNNSAFMSFHRGGYYAVNFGLDQDDVMRIGGWSAGANRWQLALSSGNMTVAGDVTAYSDARVKENIVTVENALEKTLQLRGVYYNRTDTDDKKRKIGVIAQETLGVLPEVVGKDNDDMYNVAYGNMGGLFIEAIKELAADNKYLREQIEELKKSIN